jgi:hypothetical protein
VLQDWTQRPGESPRAFAAFCLFRDFGALRSLDSAWRATGKAGRAPGTWTNWHREHEWNTRSRAYDTHQEALRRSIREAGLAQLETRRIEVELAEQERAEKRLTDLDSLIDRALKLPLVDTYVVGSALGEESKTKKIKGLNWMGLAKMLAARRELAELAILGVRAEAEKPPAPATTPHNFDGLRSLSDAELRQLTEAARRVSDLVRSGAAASGSQ